MPKTTKPAAALPVALLLCATLLAAGCGALDQQQRKWIFQPGEQTWWGGKAASEGMADAWIHFDSHETGAHARLHGLWLPHADPAAPVLLYLHGARWDVRSSASRMRRMGELGFSVLGIDYRGFGQSSAGLPSEAMAYEDARAAWGWLALRHPGARRYVFGHSLGAAVAVELAAQAPDAAGLIVEGGFTSIPDVFSSFKWGWLPLGPLITQRFDAASRIGQVRAPVLVLHGSQDSMIPPALGRALYERATAPKRFLLVDGGSHHNAGAVGAAQLKQELRALFGLPLQPRKPATSATIS